QPAQPGHPDAGRGQGGGLVGGAVHPTLPGRERRADLVAGSGDLRDDRGGVPARVLSWDRRIPIFGQAAQRPLVRSTIDFATERNLHVLAHCDDEALAIMLANHPRAKMIWAHTGFSTPVARLRDLLERHPALMLELSYRSGITRNGGLAPEWRDLFRRYSDRLLLGSDTWINQRWIDYGTIMRGYREWLAATPARQATRIACGKAARLYGGELRAVGR